MYFLIFCHLLCTKHHSNALPSVNATPRVTNRMTNPIINDNNVGASDIPIGNSKTNSNVIKASVWDKFSFDFNVIIMSFLIVANCSENKPLKKKAQMNQIQPTII